MTTPSNPACSFTEEDAKALTESMTRGAQHLQALVDELYGSKGPRVLMADERFNEDALMRIASRLGWTPREYNERTPREMVNWIRGELDRRRAGGVCSRCGSRPKKGGS